MANSKFRKYKIMPTSTQKLTDNVFEQLCKKYPKYKRFDVYGVKIFFFFLNLHNLLYLA
jgi:hypothetical protein